MFSYFSKTLQRTALSQLCRSKYILHYSPPELNHKRLHNANMRPIFSKLAFDHCMSSELDLDSLKLALQISPTLTICASSPVPTSSRHRFRLNKSVPTRIILLISPAKSHFEASMRFFDSKSLASCLCLSNLAWLASMFLPRSLEALVGPTRRSCIQQFRIRGMFPELRVTYSHVCLARQPSMKSFFE
jgi:hypothetical protein